MLYALKIATRYLTASKAQTALLVFGVALGVFIFIFMSALIGGLAEYILDNTVGDISHVTIQAEAEDPTVLLTPEIGTMMVAIEKANARQAVLRDAEAFIPLIEALPGALLHKSTDGRVSPFPGRTHPTTSVTGMPSAVKPFRTATRTWNSAT